MYKLPDLPYGYDALEPHIDGETMKIHHDKHHAGYVNKLNESLKGHEKLAENPVEELLMDLSSVPEEIRDKVRNFGGGHYNHSVFWESMSPEGEGKPVGSLSGKIDDTFGGFEEFKKKFEQAAGQVFGSGWAWLVVDGNGGLEIMKTRNQDSPVSENKSPILGIDVWEHAYYLKYRNERNSYIDAWWNVVDWKKAEERFEKGK